MGFRETIRDCFANAWNHQGRKSRAAYGRWLLFAIGVLALGNWLTWSWDQAAPLPTPVVLLWLALWVAILIPTWAATARRMQDAGISGRWLALLIFPLIGIGFVLGSVVRPGDAGTNQFGPDPAASSR